MHQQVEMPPNALQQQQNNIQFQNVSHMPFQTPHPLNNMNQTNFNIAQQANSIHNTNALNLNSQQNSVLNQLSPQQQQLGHQMAIVQEMVNVSDYQMQLIPPQQLLTMNNAFTNTNNMFMSKQEMPSNPAIMRTIGQQPINNTSQLLHQNQSNL